MEQTPFFFTKKSRKFYELYKMADKLDKRLSWTLNCENGLENIVKFFQETDDFEESFLDFKKLNFVYSDKKKKFIEDLSYFVVKIQKSASGWNRTLKFEIPTRKSIFVLSNNIDLFPTKKVSFHLNRKKFPLTEEQKMSERFSEEKLLGTKEVDEYVIDYMKKSYELLQKALYDFKSN